jgi:MFS family permease
MRNTLLPLLTTLAVQVLVSMAAFTVPVFAPAAAAEIGISPGYTGVFVSLIYGAGMLSSLVSGDLIKRLGAIRVSQYCLVACTVGLALTALGAIPMLILGALAIGVGYGQVTPASSHILARTTEPEMMSLVFSLKQTGVPIGGALAGALVPLLVLWGGWRESCVIVAIACTVVAALAQNSRALYDDDRKAGHRVHFGSITGSLRMTLRDPALRRLAVSSFFFASVQLCLISYLVTFLSQDLGYSLLSAGLMLSVAQGGGIVGRIIWGAAAGRVVGPVRLLALLGCAMGLASILTGFFTAHWPLVVILVVSAIFGATAIGWNGVFLAEVAKLAPPGRAAIATGGALFFTYFGVFVGPTVFALLVEHGLSYRGAFIAVAVPVLASGARLFWTGRDEALSATNGAVKREQA